MNRRVSKKLVCDEYERCLPRPLQSLNLHVEVLGLSILQAEVIPRMQWHSQWLQVDVSMRERIQYDEK